MPKAATESRNAGSSDNRHTSGRHCYIKSNSTEDFYPPASVSMYHFKPTQ